MGLGEIWDYFMRRKRLLLSVIVASAAIVFLGCKICFGRVDETVGVPAPEAKEVAEIEMVEIEVPKTGGIAEIIAATLAESVEAGCNTELADWSGIMLGSGENTNAEFPSPDPEAEITFWGAEAPAVMIKPAELDLKDSSKTEGVIIALGILAEVAVLGAGKFVFDRYVR